MNSPTQFAFWFASVVQPSTAQRTTFLRGFCVSLRKLAAEFLDPAPRLS